jgi:hypothetical protein
LIVGAAAEGDRLFVGWGDMGRWSGERDDGVPGLSGVASGRAESDNAVTPRSVSRNFLPLS